MAPPLIEGNRSQRETQPVAQRQRPVASSDTIQLTTPPYVFIHIELLTRRKSQSEIDPKFIFEFYCRLILIFFLCRLFVVDVCTFRMPSICCCLFKLLVSGVTLAFDSVTRAHFGGRRGWKAHRRAAVNGLTLLDIYECILHLLLNRLATEMWMTQF